MWNSSTCGSSATATNVVPGMKGKCETSEKNGVLKVGLDTKGTRVHLENLTPLRLWISWEVDIPRYFDNGRGSLMSEDVGDCQDSLIRMTLDNVGLVR